MNLWELPTSLEVNGTEWAIRTDFRAIISILLNFDDVDLDYDEQVFYCLDVLYKDFDSMPEEYYAEAIEKAYEFITIGNEVDNDKRQAPRLMDWEKDATLYMPAINRVLRCETRALKYLHWWTFMGAYMEIGECAFASVVSIRDKKARKVKLEKEEERFYRDNKDIIDLRPRLTKYEREEKERLLKMLDG